jgi:hypothetical protein
MRKVFCGLLLGTMVALGADAVASGQSTCGGLYQPACPPPPAHVKARPTIKTAPLSVECTITGKTKNLGTISVHAAAGIKEIVIRVNGKVFKRYHYKSPGPINVKLKGLKIPTKGLRAHDPTIEITCTDDEGRKVSRFEHFALCAKPMPPRFTG